MSRSLFFGLLLLLTSACRERTFTFEIPDGYTGWVTVQFGRNGCSDAQAATRTTIRVRADGSACTSVRSYPKTSWFSEFYYVADGGRTKMLRPTGWGEGGMIWAESTEIDGHEYRFFVGTEKQLKDAWNTRANVKR
jgi:hypothetical protein